MSYYGEMCDGTNNIGIQAWRLALKELPSFKEGKGVPKKGSDDYKEAKKRQAELMISIVEAKLDDAKTGYTNECITLRMPGKIMPRPVHIRGNRNISKTSNT